MAEAGEGQVEGDGAAVTVPLTDVDDEVLWFQDRPGSAAGRMTVSDFVEPQAVNASDTEFELRQ
ncbi:MAG: hypothetical protein GY812_02505 [Actinomycetia bacterium]|nr:hypothetical protein [Actinomycetes bacterium]